MDPEEQQRVLALPKVHEVGRFWSTESMHEKPLRRLQQIHRWYDDDRIANLLIPLTRQGDRLSLRALDWLVTNFSKRNNVVLADETTAGPPLNVHFDYKSMLTFWRRKNFDPFRRHARIYFYWKPRGNRIRNDAEKVDESEEESEEVLEETTVGQLNFLHWAELHGIIAYARENVNEIEKDMATVITEIKALKKLEKQTGVKRKRHELTKAPKKSCFVYNINAEVDLNPEETPESAPLVV